MIAIVLSQALCQQMRNRGLAELAHPVCRISMSYRWFPAISWGDRMRVRAKGFSAQAANEREKAKSDSAAEKSSILHPDTDQRRPEGRVTGLRKGAWGNRRRAKEESFRLSPTEGGNMA
jgi:hypothetical protein